MESLERTFQVGKGNTLVNQQAFHLMEHRRVGRVESVSPEYASRADDPYRRLHLFHRSYLHRRSMSSQDLIFGYKECVARIPRRMPDRKVERIEIVIGALDFGTVFYRVAHGNEDIF